MAKLRSSAFAFSGKMQLFATLYVLLSSSCLAKLANIVFILTDDQDVELGSQVPIKKIRNLIGNEGITFENMFVSSPLCCPSRSSIMTGKYVHNHRAANNSLEGGCSSTDWQRQQEPSAFPVHLQKAGYKTMFAGKYLNQHRKAMKFLSQQTPDSPFFMMLSTPACHAPFTPADPYNNSFPTQQAPRNGSFNIKAKNKHWLIQQTIIPMPDNTVTYIDNTFRNRWRTLLSVDDMVENIYNMLNKNGMLNNTYIFFSSDNGYHLGQFGLSYDKRQLYEFDIRVPLMVRGPGIKAGQVTKQNAMNIDLGPTFIALAGKAVPTDMDGQSLTSLWTPSVAPPAGDFRADLLVEHYGEHGADVAGCPQYQGQGMFNCDPNCVCEDSWNNTFSCIRADRPPYVYKYCVMKDNVNFVEVYELTGDHYEFENIADTADPTVLASLKADLVKLETCAGTSCNLRLPK